MCNVDDISKGFIFSLVESCAAIRPILSDHLSDHDGEILPHLVMADITRWLVKSVGTNGVHDTATSQVLGFIDASFGKNEKIDELIAVSMLENLPYKGEEGEEIVSCLTEKLKLELIRVQGLHSIT